MSYQFLPHNECYEEWYPDHARDSCDDDHPVNAEANGHGCWRCNAIYFDKSDRLRAENASLRESVAAKDGEIARLKGEDEYNRVIVAGAATKIDGLAQQLAAIQLYSKGLREALEAARVWSSVALFEEFVKPQIEAALSAPAPDLSENNHCEQVLHMVAAIQANAEKKVAPE